MRVRSHALYVEACNKEILYVNANFMGNQSLNKKKKFSLVPDINVEKPVFFKLNYKTKMVYTIGSLWHLLIMLKPILILK